jgi:hypothetical protein
MSSYEDRVAKVQRDRMASDTLAEHQRQNRLGMVRNGQLAKLNLEQARQAAVLATMAENMKTLVKASDTNKRFQLAILAVAALGVLAAVLIGVFG